MSPIQPQPGLFAVREQEPLPAQPFHRWDLPDGSSWTLFYRTETGYLLRFPGLADFSITADGLQVAAWLVPGASRQTAEHLYLNQVLPLAWSRQYKLVLHASAINIGQTAVAFAGKSGQGKSTLAASFATSGQHFLSDDGLQVLQQGGVWLAQPSHPSIRLWDDSRMVLVPEGAQTAPTLPGTPKARLLADERIPYCNTALPLAAICFLGDGLAPAPCLTRLLPKQALLALAKNCFLLDIEEHEMLQKYFSQLAALARTPFFFLLDYPRDYACLPEVRALICRQMAELTGSGGGQG